MHHATSPASIGVVLVPPLLHEHPRSRRFVAEVASQLAASGLPCLRFDFHGTGDSPGRGDEVDFASMAGDLEVATAALRSHHGVEQVVLLAWRGRGAARPAVVAAGAARRSCRALGADHGWRRLAARAAAQ
jgi:alpha-beta hydrolase superfamily lysophospholipase